MTMEGRPNIQKSTRETIKVNDRRDNISKLSIGQIYFTEVTKPRNQRTKTTFYRTKFFWFDSPKKITET